MVENVERQKQSFAERWHDPVVGWGEESQEVDSWRGLGACDVPRRLDRDGEENGVSHDGNRLFCSQRMSSSTFEVESMQRTRKMLRSMKILGRQQREIAPRLRRHPF